jgi:hypothetical protein
MWEFMPSVSGGAGTSFFFFFLHDLDLKHEHLVLIAYLKVNWAMRDQRGKSRWSLSISLDNSAKLYATKVC